jgi:hypothetical protein
VTVTNRKFTRYTRVVWFKEKLRTHYEGRKGLEDLGGRLQLCPRNEKTSSWTYRKTIDSVKIAKQKAGSYAASRKINDCALWRGRHLPKRNKETAHRAGASPQDYEENLEDFIGCCSGRTHVRRERWRLLENDHL